MTSQASMEPDSRTRADYAYEVIKRDIVRCDLEPGSQVTEVQLAKRYNIGRAGVRTALSRLHQDRLVRSVPRKGYIIAPITLKGVQDLFAVRLLLEPEAVKLAAGQIDASRLQCLDRQLRKARYQLGDRESAVAFLRVNTEFHVTIAAASGNDRLAELLADLLNEMERLFCFGLMRRDRNEEMYHEHHELIEALIAGDGEQAEQIARDQILTSQTMVVDALYSNPNLQSVSLTMP